MHSVTSDTHFWDQAARKYARDPIKDMAGYERTIVETLSYLGPEDAVLEIGCGTGTTALRLAPHVRRLVATDVSSEMIAIAREKAAESSSGNVEFAIASADQLPAEANAFDAVLAFNVFHLVADRTSVLADVLRALKPGGLLISKTPCLSEMNPMIRLAVPVMRRLGKAPYVAVFSAAELESGIASAGFAMIERARHGSRTRDARIFLVARKPA